ncbi:DUF7657 domain-containing protein [Undibacterium luofuense]|uniref:DUF7657 domain-containing protein n=1 Tax=Undibacterium luofuense TaxID=2828733 RepID=A0A941DHC7_9BURK|nr:hypothetical protein [Undibacterium luofuense]MBR7780768.1 hypothetical protein [Undibacterium luofuense]
MTDFFSALLRKPRMLAATLALMFGALYVSQCWSPSSYGFVLEQFWQSPQTGIVAGKPRPVRSDEWSVVTPLTQATVNNHLERYNKTSLYQEDLRINYGMPIADWGMALKPTMWAYLLTDPAYAYSLHWYLIFVLFIAGYALLFRKAGLSAGLSVIISMNLYLTGFSQFWWNEKGPVFALFPWVLLPWMTSWPLWLRALTGYWLAASWLLTNFYPPVQVSLAFVGIIYMLTVRPDLFRKSTLPAVLMAGAAAAGTTVWYLWDYLSQTATTLYPGGRHVGGGGVSAQVAASWFFPAISFDRLYRPLTDTNISETGAVGMYLFPLLMCFTDLRALRTSMQTTALGRQLRIAGSGLAMMCAWILLPLPAWAGKIFLWDHIPPVRMQFASGVLMTFIAVLILKHAQLRISLARTGIFTALTIGCWLLFKYGAGYIVWEDLIFLGILLICLLLVHKKTDKLKHHLALISCLLAFIVFGRFNPLQSAWPIFHLPQTQVLSSLRQMQNDNQGVLAASGFIGATLNGAGFRSVTHVTPVPHLAYWAAQFPAMQQGQRLQVFNRYSHLQLDDITQPYSPRLDVVVIPLTHFQPGIPHRVSLAVSNTAQLTTGGRFIVTNNEHGLILKGWLPADFLLSNTVFQINGVSADTANAARIYQLSPAESIMDGDDQQTPIPLLNGFSIHLPEQLSLRCLTLTARQNSDGKAILIRNPDSTTACPT